MASQRDAILERLIQTEWPRLRRFFHTKVPDSDVLDLVQQTMLAFVEGRAAATGSEKAYLWGIARKQVLKHYERHKPSVAFESALHTALDVGPSLSSRLDDRNRLLRALHALPLDHQIAFELRHGEELPLEEVASALDVSLATVKRYLASAQAKLRDLLDCDPEHLSDDYRAL